MHNARYMMHDAWFIMIDASCKVNQAQFIMHNAMIIVCMKHDAIKLIKCIRHPACIPHFGYYIPVNLQACELSFRASCIVKGVSHIMQFVSFIALHESCLVHHVSCPMHHTSH